MMENRTERDLLYHIAQYLLFGVAMVSVKKCLTSALSKLGFLSQ